MTTMDLPAPVMALYDAHLAMCKHFRASGLRFTLDGKLVGDIAEVLVAEHYEIDLCERRTPGVDGHARDGRSVQIKSTISPRAGPAFTPGLGVSDHMIFVWINFPGSQAKVLYNGPEANVRALLPANDWSGTRRISLNRVLRVDATIADGDRLLVTRRQ